MHAASHGVEFLLVDGGILQSRSSAIQIGHESRAAFSSLVFQNISIEQSHRCLAAPALPLAPWVMQYSIFAKSQQCLHTSQHQAPVLVLCLCSSMLINKVLDEKTTPEEGSFVLRGSQGRL